MRRVDARNRHEDGRISSKLFLDRGAQPSVHLERFAILRDIKRDRPETLFWLRINVGKIHREGLGKVTHKPTSSDYSHCLIYNPEIEGIPLKNSQINKRKYKQSIGLLNIVTEKVELSNGDKVVSPFNTRNETS
ncbi:MAG: hypothetical protein ACP5VS_19550 [Desulfomonilaceae bacterium]